MFLFIASAFFVLTATDAIGDVTVKVDSVAALVAALRDQPERTQIRIAPGIYRLSAPLDLQTGVQLTGAGFGKTTIASSEA